MLDSAGNDAHSVESETCPHAVVSDTVHHSEVSERDPHTAAVSATPPHTVESVTAPHSVESETSPGVSGAGPEVPRGEANPAATISTLPLSHLVPLDRHSSHPLASRNAAVSHGTVLQPSSVACAVQQLIACMLRFRSVQFCERLQCCTQFSRLSCGPAMSELHSNSGDPIDQ